MNHDGRAVEILEQLQRNTDIRLDNIEKELRELIATINLARGGLRMLVILGTASAAISTIAIAIWNAVRSQHT